jgi:uncharacterized RDD family membrane protein YckC
VQLASWIQLPFASGPRGASVFGKMSGQFGGRQLRIVDGHGLTPPTTILTLRSVFQFLPLWAATAYHLNAATGRPYLAAAVAAIGFLWPAADVVWTLFSRRGVSLHDLLFKTRVVLDVPPAVSESDRAA